MGSSKHNRKPQAKCFKVKTRRVNENTFVGEIIDIDLDKMREFVQEYYGKRCRTFDINCPGCQMWMSYDVFESNKKLLTENMFKKSTEENNGRKKN